MTCNADKTTKTCTKCGETKPIEEFSRDQAKRDGHRAYCRTCDSARKREWRKATREWHLAGQAAWERMNAEAREAYSRRRQAGDLT